MKYIVLSGSKGAIGKGDAENEDAFFERRVAVSSGGEALFFGVADGVSRCDYGGAVARWVCNYLSEMSIRIESAGGVANTIPREIRCARALFQTSLGESLGFSESCCTLTVGVIVDDQFHGLWVGDSPILYSSMVADQLVTECITKPDHMPDGSLSDGFSNDSKLDIKHVTRALEPGDVVTLATDGLMRVWDPVALSGLYTRGVFDASLRNAVLKYAFKDDATFVAVQATA